MHELFMKPKTAAHPATDIADEGIKSGDVSPSKVPVYSPVYDEDALNRFAEVGRKAWADVPDAAAWVRELRGGS